MSYAKLFLVGLVAALVTTGCGRVAPTGLSIDSKAGNSGTGNKLGSNCRR